MARGRKTGGRKAGTPNKATSATAAAIAASVGNPQPIVSFEYRVAFVPAAPVKKLASFRSPDTATAEDLRAFQLHLTATGVQPTNRQRHSDCCASSSR